MVLKINTYGKITKFICECLEFYDVSPLRKLITISSFIHISVQNKKHFVMYSIKDNKLF